IIRKMTKLPVIVGFGVSTPAQAKEISKNADGVIVGSAIIKLIEASYGKKDFLAQIACFISALRKGVQ
ncbi:MAG: tryptophan synthase subunit alpha, partial [Candidatus Heimdallarchaeota archaeon]|nr:tryptophan synthase subunit alpha [Candidatus Heimdallarchaeota archaeon]